MPLRWGQTMFFLFKLNTGQISPTKPLSIMKSLENLLKAVTILNNHHSNELVINKPKENGFANVNNLFIKECVPAVINELKDAGFSLSMRGGMLEVDDVFMQ